MVCWTGRRQVAHGKAQSQTREKYDCGHAEHWFRSVKFKRLDSLLFHGLGFWLGWRDRAGPKSRVPHHLVAVPLFWLCRRRGWDFRPDELLRASARGRAESQTRASASFADTSFPSFPNS